jgi:hypothetical protein
LKRISKNEAVESLRRAPSIAAVMRFAQNARRSK